MPDFTHELDGYLAAARKTAIYPGRGGHDGLVYTVVGLASEAGEAAGKLQKQLRGDRGWIELRDGLISELGDVLWHAAMVADELNARLSDVAQRNVDKLQDRADRGTLNGSGDER